MKVFVTGVKGQLGRDCVGALGKLHDVAGADLPEMDITRVDSVRSFLRDFAPDAIINAAAFTNVDACETEQEQAWAVNADGARAVANVAGELGARLIHISTDYVFDGQLAPPGMYTETDPANPVSRYGLSKLDGERAVLAEDARHTIVRTAWLYGMHGRNFLKSVLRAALQSPGRALKVVNDQHGSPTWSYRLALQIGEMLKCAGGGVYHAAGEGACTRHALAAYFLAKMGVSCEVTPCATADYPTPATRPANSALENRRTRTEQCCVMVPWQRDIDSFVERYGNGLLDEARGDA